MYKITVRMKYIFSLYLSIFFLYSTAQQEKRAVVSVGFYNLENFFDTIQDVTKNDHDFLPNGPKRYTSQVYWVKVNNLARAISQIGIDITPDGVAILGCSEIENKLVLEDLCKHEKLKSRNYKIIHFDSKDERGVDVALLYSPKYFKPLDALPLFVALPAKNAKGSKYTRDVLYVKGLLLNDTVHIFVNHWPSRLGGEAASSPLRELAASVNKKVIDTLLFHHANILLMGDFNDNPNNASIAKILSAKGDKKEVGENDLFNPFYNLYKQGIGTLAYRDEWNLFDQIIISSVMINKNNGLYFYKPQICNFEFLKNQTGRYKGYPHRTYLGDLFEKGYSDHFPVCIYLLKKM